MDLGAIAQLVERLNGIQEVSGSTPLSSTMKPRSQPLRGFAFCYAFCGPLIVTPRSFTRPVASE
jgi:hypothetical protein